VLDKIHIPKIVTVFDSEEEKSTGHFYREIISNILCKILPRHVFKINDQNSQFMSGARFEFNALLPLMTSNERLSAPTTMSFFCLSKFRQNSFSFFHEMISRWLIPEKRLKVVLVYATDFSMPDFSQDKYTLCEVMIHIENGSDLIEIRKNLPLIENDIRLGMETGYFSRRILEVKGISMDDKTALIREYMVFLLQTLPKEFDQDLWNEMQHVLIQCKDEFKALRECRHLSRIIAVHYLFRRSLRESVKESSSTRFLSLKLFRARLKTQTGSKQVLGLLVGLNFIRDKEVFEKRHLLNSIQNYIPNAVAVDNSFFANRRGFEHICTLYMEIEKSNGQDFTSEEIKILRRELPVDLKDRIEHLMHPVFMPRNEEEIMRNILSLSAEIKFLKDAPQMFITFDEQTHANLFFNIVLVRVMSPGAPSIQEKFKNADSYLEYIHDRCKMVGAMRKKYTKEATVFRVKLPKEIFLRRDHSIDLYKARLEVVSELSRILGDIRDFNGGMILKQNELLEAVAELLHLSNVRYNDLILENFFYSLTPVIMRTVLEPVALKTLFLMLLDAVDHSFFDEKSYWMKTQNEAEFVFIMIKSNENDLKDSINKALDNFHLHFSEVACSSCKVHEIPYLGYIYRSDDPSKQKQFIQIIQDLLN
jgi:hypothetical protein